MLDKDLWNKLHESSRYKTHVVKVGQVKIGGDNHIVVQSMVPDVYIDPNGVKNSAKVIFERNNRKLAHAGLELVRVASCS